jgi:hypothetical protein
VERQPRGDLAVRPLAELGLGLRIQVHADGHVGLRVRKRPLEGRVVGETRPPAPESKRGNGPRGPGVATPRQGTRVHRGTAP